MSTPNNLITFYTDLLTDVGFIVTESGEIFVSEDTPLITEVEGKDRHMVVPTKEQLAREDSSDLVFFHPACESLYRGRSEVLNALSMAMATRIWHTGLMTVTALLNFASDKDAHKKATQRQAELLMAMDVVSKATQGSWMTITNKLTPPGEQGDHPLLRLNLTRSVKVDDKEYKRACEIRFPLLEDETLCGVKLSKSGEQAIKGALNLAFGDTYYVGVSNAMTAPYFQALCEAYYQVMTHIHKVASQVKRYLTGRTEIKPFCGQWHKNLGNLEAWYKSELNLVLTGNQGLGGKEEPKVEAPAAPKPRVTARNVQSATQAPTAPTMPASPQQAPAQQMPANQTTGSGAGAGLGLRTSGDPKPHQPFPANPQQPQQHMQGYPQPYPQQQMMHQQQLDPRKPNQNAAMMYHQPQMYGQGYYQQPGMMPQQQMMPQYGGYPQQQQYYAPNGPMPRFIDQNGNPVY